MFDLSHLTFEQALKEMDSLIHLLEDGKTTLDQAIAAYERGAALKNYCEEHLQKARTRISQVMVTREAGVQFQSLEAMPGEGSA